MKILDWYLLGWCIGGKKCVAHWKHGDVTFDLGAVTFNLESPSILYLLKKIQILERYMQGRCIRPERTKVRHVVDSWRCNLAWKNPATGMLWSMRHERGLPLQHRVCWESEVQRRAFCGWPGTKVFLWDFLQGDITENEMVQGPCAHLQSLHETSTIVLDRLSVIIDRLKVISSGSVHHAFQTWHSPNAKVCFEGDHLTPIFEVWSGRNLVEMWTMLEYSR
jgi:hypothetical protein